MRGADRCRPGRPAGGRLLNSAAGVLTFSLVLHCIEEPALKSMPMMLRRLGMVRLAVVAIIGLPLSFGATSAAQTAADFVVGIHAGVRLEVRPRVRHPRVLRGDVTAVFVVIENNSNFDLLMRPESFTILSSDGEIQQAIPPPDLRRSPETSPFEEPAIAMSALPRDVLGRGARTQGFLYFGDIDQGGSWTLDFVLRRESDAAAMGVIRVRPPAD